MPKGMDATAHIQHADAGEQSFESKGNAKPVISDALLAMGGSNSFGKDLNSRELGLLRPREQHLMQTICPVRVAACRANNGSMMRKILYDQETTEAAAEMDASALQCNPGILSKGTCRRSSRLRTGSSSCSASSSQVNGPTTTIASCSDFSQDWPLSRLDGLIAVATALSAAPASQLRRATAKAGNETAPSLYRPHAQDTAAATRGWDSLSAGQPAVEMLAGDDPAKHDIQHLPDGPDLDFMQMAVEDLFPSDVDWLTTDRSRSLESPPRGASIPNFARDDQVRPTPPPALYDIGQPAQQVHSMNSSASKTGSSISLVPGNGGHIHMPQEDSIAQTKDPSQAVSGKNDLQIAHPPAMVIQPTQAADTDNCCGTMLVCSG